MRVEINLMKPLTEIIDLSKTINPRVGDDDLLLPLHIVYGDNQTDMRGKDVEFISEDTNKQRIYVGGTCNTDTPGDNLYMGNLTFRFPANTFKADGTYDPDKTMFRIVDKATNKVISSVNVKITVMKNSLEFDFDPDNTSYDSRMEEMLHGFHDKGQAMLDDIKDLNDQAKSNVSGDTATTAKEAKKQADQNAGDISDMQNEIAGARGRFANMAGREDAQDAAINQKESIVNANANYAALKQKDAQQDEVLATKARQDFIIDYLSRMYLQPEGFENEAALKAKYPNGKPGIMVTLDTGHKWIWSDNQWKDRGVYNAIAMTEREKAIANNSFTSVMMITDDTAKSNTGKDANELDSSILYIALDGRDKSTREYMINLHYPPVTALTRGVMLTYHIADDNSGSVQVLIANDSLWQRYESQGQWSDWNLVGDEYRATAVISNQESTFDANQLGTGEYYVAIDGRTTADAEYFHDKLHLPYILGTVALGRLSVLMNKSNDGGSQVLFAGNNIYTRSASGGEWSDWTQIKNTKQTEFSRTMVINGSNLDDQSLDANGLKNGVYFLALDGTKSAGSQEIAKLHYPAVRNLQLGAFYSQVDDSSDSAGVQFFVTQDEIYVRSHASALNDGKWTDWKTIGAHGIVDDKGYTKNRAVFFGDSRMAGLLANGAGYADPLPYQAISNINHYQATGNATSGTGFVFTIDGTNAVTEAQRHNFNDFEIAVFAYGINDYMQNQELGELGDSEDSNTVMGAMLKATKTVYKSNPDCSLIFVLPFLSANFGTESTRYALDQKNNAQTPYTLQEMQDKMAAFCEKYAIPYVDTRKGCPINPLNVEQMLGDKVHPVSTKEYDVYIQWLAGRLDSLIKAINY